MNTGKVASQAGHAFLDAYLLALESDPARCAAYRAVRHGTKVVLAAGIERILRVHARARELGLPCALIIDEGCPGFFEGKPTLTALGAGPLTRSEANKLLGGLPLLAGEIQSSPGAQLPGTKTIIKQ